MEALMFNINISENENYHARRKMQEIIEELENTFSKLDEVYYKFSRPREENHKNIKSYISHCLVINQNKKYDWNKIEKEINKIYKGNYVLKDINKNQLQNLKQIKYNRKNNIKIICSSLIEDLKNFKRYSVGFILDGIKDKVYINKVISKNGNVKWKYNKTNDLILNKNQQNEIIKVLEKDPPNSFKFKQYLKPEIEVIDDFSKILFEEEINVGENKNVDLYFCNAYCLFLTPLENYKYNYYDGYLELNLKDKTSKIELVIISDDNDRIYFEYTPTLEETLTLIKVAEKYSQKINDKSLKELIEEIEEEEKMNYIDVLIKEKRKLNEEIRKCEDKDFERLVYKYNFYTLLENTIENQMIEDTYRELLSSENTYEKLYKKFMDWIDAPNLIDDFVLVTFLQEIENENNNQEEENREI